MDMSYSSIALSVFAVYVTYVGYRLLNWVWLTPKKQEKILRKQGLTGNPYRFLVGDMLDFVTLRKHVLSKPISFSDDNKQRVIPYILHTLKTYGKNSFMWVGVKPRVNITEPELVREVLTKYTTYTKMVHTLDPIVKLLATGVTILEGDAWHTRRRTLNSVFHMEKLKLMTPAFYMSCLDMVNKWEKMISADGSAEVEVHHDLVTLSGDGTSRTLFGSNFEEGRKIFELINELTDLSIQVINSVYIPGWRFMPTKRNNRMKRIDKEIRALITEMINNRKKEMSTEEEESDDFLGILLKCNSNENEQHKNKNAALSIREIIDECIQFYFHFLVHGKNSFMWVGVKPRVNITEPELVREVLTKYTTYTKMVHTLDPIVKLLATGVTILEGDEWHTRRRTLNSVFHMEKLKLMTPAFYMSCLDMVNKWEKMISADGSAEVEVHHDLVTLSGDGTSRTLFGSNFEEGRKIFELINELTDLSIEVINSVYIPGWRFMPTKRNNRMKRIDKEIRALITEMINNRKKEMSTEEEESDDFLGILLKCNSNENEQHKNKNAALSIREIIDECIQFYFAGQDTTATLLLWTMVLLSRYPDWQARAREEVLQAFGDNVPDYEGLNHLKVVSMILNEVLRLYPPIVELTKIVQKDTKLGDLFLPAGSQVMLPIIQQHHDPEIWGDDVKEFKPERFSQGVIKATKKPGSFFPFSLGPRMCIGQNFALLEAKMALTLILRRFSFELSPSYVHAPYPLVTMHPEFGAPLLIHKL